MATKPDASVLEVVQTRDLRASLLALADRLAEDVDDKTSQTKQCPKCKGEVSFRPTGSQLASVVKELRAVLDQIESLPKVDGSQVDDLAAQRAARRAAEVPDAPAVGEQRGARGRRSRK